MCTAAGEGLQNTSRSHRCRVEEDLQVNRGKHIRQSPIPHDSNTGLEEVAVYSGKTACEMEQTTPPLLFEATLSHCGQK